MTVVWLPFLYEASVREPRWQKPKAVFLAERQPVEVVAINAQDAPIVASSSTTWRKHDQAFLRPVLHPVSSTPLTPRQLQVLADSGVDWPAYPMIATGTENPFSKRRHDPSRKCLILSRSVDPARAAASEHATHLRLLDGEFWIECPEPVVVVEFASDSSLGHIQVRVTDDWNETKAGAHFALTDLDGSMAYAANLARTLNRSAPRRPPLRLLRPDLLAFQAGGLLARQVIHHLRATLPDFAPDAELMHSGLWTRIAAVTTAECPEDGVVLDIAVAALDLELADNYPTAAEKLAIRLLRHVHLPVLSDLIRSFAATLIADRDLAAFRTTP